MIKDVLDATCKAINQVLKNTPLAFMNESVFRFFFVQNLLPLHKDYRCQIEWHHVDLLIQKRDKTIPVEFKFYVLPKSYCLSGERFHYKGGLSRQNFREFCNCVETLANIHDAPFIKKEAGRIWKKYLVLVYVHHPSMKRTYCSYYDCIQLPKEQKKTCRIVKEYNAPTMIDPTTEENLICKLIEIE